MLVPAHKSRVRQAEGGVHAPLEVLTTHSMALYRRTVLEMSQTMYALLA